MTTTWILVANASTAALYANRGPHKGLELMKQFQHAESRERTGEIITDRPGHYQTDGGAHGAYSQTTDPKQHEEDKFAAELARELETGRTGNHYARLILVASNPFMGKLNKQLNMHVRSLATDTVEKDYTHLAERDLASHLENILYV
jgi:protein required for attachment to host cells